MFSLGLRLLGAPALELGVLIGSDPPHYLSHFSGALTELCAIRFFCNQRDRRHRSAVGFRMSHDPFATWLRPLGDEHRRTSDAHDGQRLSLHGQCKRQEALEAEYDVREE